MEEILAKILAVDERAKKIAADGTEVTDGIGSDLSEKIEQLKKNIDEKFSEEIEQETKKNREAADNRISELKNNLEQKKLEMKRQFDTNKDKWISEIMEEIVG